MTQPDRFAGWVARLRHPQTTVRWRLTLLYGGLFLISGAVLLTITYTLVDHAPVGRQSFHQLVVKNDRGVNPPPTALPPGARFQAVGNSKAVPAPTVIKKLLGSQLGRYALTVGVSAQRISDLHQLVVESAIALAIMAVISAALGWAVAGRVLRPLRTMTATTQVISEANLHRRLDMQGPPDELRELADTIDGLLGRLQGAFDAQRRFVANASHELRTPLTAVRALLEMVISDPDATVTTFRNACRQVLEENEQQEQLIDALLALAQGQRGLDRRAPLDLAALTEQIADTYKPDAAARGVYVHASVETAEMSGDVRLIERLVSNLVENAIRHNNTGGRVEIAVSAPAGDATLTVANTGPVVPPDEVDRLLQPFQRLAPDRTGHDDGIGLGLSIVAAVAKAHEASLEVVPRLGGGLEISVRFPREPGALTDPSPAPVLDSQPV